MTTAVFDLHKIIVHEPVYDTEINAWISAINYINKDNNLLLRLPLMNIHRLSLEANNKSNHHRVKLTARLHASHTDFTKTFYNIEKFILQKMNQFPAFMNKEIKHGFRRNLTTLSSTTHLFSMYVPTEKKNVIVHIIKKENPRTLLSLSDLSRDAPFYGILYLSHVEIQKTSFTLIWNIIQIILE